MANKRPFNAAKISGFAISSKKQTKIFYELGFQPTVGAGFARPKMGFYVILCIGRANPAPTVNH